MCISRILLMNESKSAIFDLNPRTLSISSVDHVGEGGLLKPV